MFPTFVTSFQDQFLAVLINVFGTIVGSFFTQLFKTVGDGLLLPVLARLINALLPQGAGAGS